MKLSNWNLFFDRLLAEKLTANEARVAHVLGRYLLGWNRTKAGLGRKMLREAAGLPGSSDDAGQVRPMNGKSFDRALAGLVEKNIVTVTPGGKGQGGRGYRTVYELILEPPESPALPRTFTDEETPALERTFTEEETSALPRTKGAKRKVRAGAPKGTRQRGHALKEAREEQPNPAAPAPNVQALVGDAITAYLGHGGSLTMHDRRPTLAAHTKRLAEQGISRDIILAAAAELGRENAFPGELTKRAKDYATNGVPCHWRGDREGLRADQLAQCGCAGCQDWIAALATPVASTP